MSSRASGTSKKIETTEEALKAIEEHLGHKPGNPHVVLVQGGFVVHVDGRVITVASDGLIIDVSHAGGH